MSILWIILIVVLVLALLGFVGRGRLVTGVRDDTGPPVA